MTNWEEIAKTIMVGKKIVDAGYVDKKEAEEYMWNVRGVWFQLDDGTRLISMRDEIMELRDLEKKLGDVLDKLAEKDERNALKREQRVEKNNNLIDTISKEAFNRYLDVQKSGQFNMFDVRAREAADLTKEQFLIIIDNYDELTDKYEGE